MNAKAAHHQGVAAGAMCQSTLRSKLDDGGGRRSEETIENRIKHSLLVETSRVEGEQTWRRCHITTYYFEILCATF